MISVIYGAKGSGKTKRIIDAVNNAGDKASGQVVFITDNGESLGIDPDVKFIDLREYAVKSEAEFIGFLKGMLAADFDIQSVYIDGLSRLLNVTADKLKPVFDAMGAVPSQVDFVVTVSADTLPNFMKPFALKG